MVLKAASFAPQSALRITELWKEAGLPGGVLNIVTTSRNEAEIFLKHPDIRGVTFVGSTSVGLARLCDGGCQRQTRAGADRGQEPRVGDERLRNRAHRAGHHQLFLRLRRRTLHGVAGVVVENAIADKLVEALVQTGKAGQPRARLRQEHRHGSGGQPGAQRLRPQLDRNRRSRKAPNSFSTAASRRSRADARRASTSAQRSSTTSRKRCRVGREEIFGPVLCIKRVDSFEEGLAIMNNSRFANGSVIYTESGHYAREFAKTHGRRHGRRQRRHSRSRSASSALPDTSSRSSATCTAWGATASSSITETKNVTTTWFTGKEIPAKVSTWDGTMTR